MDTVELVSKLGDLTDSVTPALVIHQLPRSRTKFQLCP